MIPYVIWKPRKTFISKNNLRKETIISIIMIIGLIKKLDRVHSFPKN